MRGLSADELLRLPVRLHGIRLGRPVDLILDTGSMRALGLDVRCGDELHSGENGTARLPLDGELKLRERDRLSAA